ncbi:hypothetical protein HX049_03710 [Myroides odoratimimus]|uniref:Rieske (2Fe-2S) protein n=1 Tax=Myroides odoratimimus TaxID=76832 RepID=UPI002576EFF9|nr:hypothetical protein [Myroides odoratimimus]MDM1396286.1 hypothetical protein [Myroides odoratimimus]
MKRLFLILFTLLISTACSKSGSGYHNPYLPNVKVNLMVNLYQADADFLRYQNGTYVTYNHGIIGVAIFNAGSQYFAYDLTCPDHAFDPVTSRLIQKKPNDPYVYCTNKLQHNGEEPAFYLGNGQSIKPGLKYNQLKPYPVRQSGDNIFVTY